MSCPGNWAMKRRSRMLEATDWGLALHIGHPYYITDKIEDFLTDVDNI
jgi:hypothetical protein